MADNLLSAAIASSPARPAPVLTPHSALRVFPRCVRGAPLLVLGRPQAWPGAPVRGHPRSRYRAHRQAGALEDGRVEDGQEVERARVYKSCCIDMLYLCIRRELIWIHLPWTLLMGMGPGSFPLTLVTSSYFQVAGIVHIIYIFKAQARYLQLSTFGCPRLRSLATPESKNSASAAGG